MLRRVLASALAIVIAALLFVGSWPQLFGLHRTLVFAELVALRGLIAAIALVLIVALAVVAALSRSLRPVAAALAIALAVVVAINAAVLATRGFGDPGLPDVQAGDVRVLSWNTLGDVPGTGVIAGLAIEHDADVLSLPETSEAEAEAVAASLADAGRPMQVFARASGDLRAQSTALLVSEALGRYAVDDAIGSTPRLPTVVARPVDGAGPTLVAAHPVAPLPRFLDEWEAGLEFLAELCREPGVVLAGDLNATLDHFEGLREPDAHLGACVDGAAATGNGALGTWPTRLPELLGAPIDHVMAAPEWEVVGFRVLDADAGSDHRPVLAHLRAAD